MILNSQKLPIFSVVFANGAIFLPVTTEGKKCAITLKEREKKPSLNPILWFLSDSVFSVSHFPRMNGYFCSTHYYSRFDTSPFMKDAYPVTNALPVRLASSSDQFRPFAIQMFSVCVTRHSHSSKLSLFGSSVGSLCDDLCVHSIKAHVLCVCDVCVHVYIVSSGGSRTSCWWTVCTQYHGIVHVLSVFNISGGSRISCWRSVCAQNHGSCVCP